MKGILRITAEKKEKSAWDATAYNWRFGAMAAVTPRKRQCLIARLSPAASSVEAATSPSRWDVRGKSADSASGQREKSL